MSTTYYAETTTTNYIILKPKPETMKIKYFELRDRSTFIPIFAFRAVSGSRSVSDDYLSRRAGFNDNRKMVIMGRLDCSGTDRNCSYDPYAWGDRTFSETHKWLEENWDKAESGSVIDVQHILGETEKPVISEAFS